MISSAENIIQSCGGPKVVAEWLGVAPSAVYRWTYPRERGGTDGRIPGFHHQRLMEKANMQGIKLSPADFFETKAGSDQ